ncbi:MAG: PilT/PilU family type 4a pilus ATPase [Alphaproteobacteria bacterium]|nr:PilT/PilU family type 4a pilus ATPase [Alphaproteobacteria bacterium]
MADASKIRTWLATMVAHKGADLYVTFGAPPTMRGEGGFNILQREPLSDEDIAQIMSDVASLDQLQEFEKSCELNMALDLGKTQGRFRINAMKQRQHTAMVIRRITAQVPTMESLGLPQVLGDLVMEKRGLVILVGGTGSGKSTTLAAMIDHRNASAPGHIITIEDPIEYIHDHKRCIVTQREVGVDTQSFDAALKNTLRQKPDVILIGEIRDSNSMQQSINIAETGHLALATLHANNANQAIERILNFFEKEMHHQILLNLSLNLKGIVSQRLVAKQGGGRALALEILLNQGLIKDLVRKGEVKEIKPVMAANTDLGMQTFDQCLFRLFVEGAIDQETALAEADSPSDLKLQMKQQLTGGGEGLSSVDTSSLSL